MSSPVRHFARLNEFEKSIALLTALIPPPVSLDTLISISAMSAVQTLQAMERLVDSGLISVHEPSGTGYYYYPDTKTVYTILNNADPRDLTENADRLTSFLAASHEEGPKKWLSLTHVSLVAGLKPQRIHDILRSAEYCLDLSLREDAAEYFRYALQHIPTPLSDENDKRDYIDAVLGMIKAQGHLTPLNEQKELLEEARAYAAQIDDLTRLAKADLVLASVCRSAGSYGKAAELFDEGWSLADQLGSDDLRKWAALSTTDFLFWQGKVADAVHRYEQVIGNLEEFPSDEATMRACATLGWCYGICGQISRGVGLIDAVRNRARKLGLKQLKAYADLRTALTLMEARRIPEVEAYLADVLEMPEDELGHYVLWSAHAMKSYVLYTKGDLEGCARMQKSAFDHSRKLGWPHHRGPWNFEYLEGVEAAGMPHPVMTYDSEIERILNWPDTYMQGVALRYRAQKNLKKGRITAETRQDLETSLELLKKAGAAIEMARTQILLSRLLLEGRETERARTLLNEAWKIFQAVNEDLFPEDLKIHLAREDHETLLARTFVEIGNTLGTVRNQIEALEKIINLTMRLTGAERGGFFMDTDKNRLKLVASRNLDMTMVQSELFRTKLATIEEVARSKTETVQKNVNGGRLPGQESEASGWTICSPVILRDRILGVLYLESNLLGSSFPDKDLPLLRAISNQVAIALDNARAYEEISMLRDRLEEETRFYRMEIESTPAPGHMVGDSKPMRWLYQQMKRVAPTDSTVLITGETGVGKELVARAIHQLSTRKEGPFIPVNIASLAPELIASELFGHERGAFTGAVRSRCGRFELASGGTLFLDEIDALSPDIQVKLLRVLQGQEFERVGGARTIRPDFRLISATNQNLESSVQKGRFRSDLYYRLSVFPVHIAPLRERKEDIPLLAMHFLGVYKTKMGKTIKGISNQDMKKLLEYPWPGNVRELQHIIERAVILTEGEYLTIPPLFEEAPEGVKSEQSFLTFQEMERRHILNALELCKWRVSGENGAARLLNLKSTTLFSKMKKLAIKMKSDGALFPAGQDEARPG